MIELSEMATSSVVSLNPPVLGIPLKQITVVITPARP
jgi:hypothetical protein